MDNDAAIEGETTTPRTHDRGEITGKPVHVSVEDEVTSEALRGGDSSTDPAAPENP